MLSNTSTTVQKLTTRQLQILGQAYLDQARDKKKENEILEEVALALNEDNWTRERKSIIPSLASCKNPRDYPIFADDLYLYDAPILWVV